MRKFTVIFLLASAVFFLQWRNSHQTEDNAAASRTTKDTASLTTPRPVYEHDWAKHALDRAQLVVSQAQTARAESERQ